MKKDRPFSLFYVQELRDNCKMVLDRIKTHGITAENYPVSAEFQDLLTMPTLRICEIIAKFTGELASLEPNYNWAAAAKMRNQIAHPYGGFDSSFVWDAAQGDIPELQAVCDSLLGGRQD